MKAHHTSGRSLAVIGLILVLRAVSAGAQSDFSGLHVRPGDVVFVTEPSGTEVSGPLTDISASALTINGFEFKPASGLKIERPGDSLRNGILIGLAVGAGLGLATSGQGCVSGRECLAGPPIVGSMAFSGAIGALIDWLRKGRSVIYDRGAALPY